ncbi:dihydrolipoyl dehydrogenase family protein [Pediococcus pentosaceus]|uniref:NAD(P)/FAD-dependent oxidoreductase n=2 Tax=Pediococcus pentosaceus TaxID=1255 RepID=A0A6L5A2A5_PEDPE|nr:NAD(P)/FAD-dependent oxidoreductase [Pediococcus pentosaceus]KAF0351513.1 hypothetical protein GBO26_00340 [Pediococcus pentosaceus]KAF0413869.1 hypothetical protein GBO79_03065 [Pediococcus pentosaceus]KAF0423272.1 hypothetical protein GBO84_08190 [Pediococcus pentosaceus]KAF0501140.1 hypothetical protein GBP22_09865 [Pediococcus pentosaceus]MBF7106274.1 NAD(P)/FAD-dependent oxidoreductase [Pediococcus pentosaceus]
MMKISETYDVAIVGSGQASWNLAIPLAKQGQKVVMLENDIWGGTCPNRGCDPKKLMSQVALNYYQAKLQASKGLGTISSFDWHALSKFKHQTIDPLTDQLHDSFQKVGITTIKAHGHFVGDKLFANRQEIHAKKIVLALGRSAVIPNILGNELLKTSTDFFDLEELPKKLTIIGAGYIAFELASIAQVAGSNVTIIQHNHRPLKQFPEVLVKDLVKQLETQGVKFLMDTDVESILGDSRHQIAHTSTGSRVESNVIIAAIGRQPNIHGVGLEESGIKADDKKGIIVDEYLQTTLPNVYATGDVISKSVPAITPTAISEAHYLSQLFTGEEKKPFSYPLIATAVYGIPRLAMVGDFSEGTNQKEISLDTLFSSVVSSEIGSKVYLSYKNNKLVGAAMLGLHADERINELALLIQKQMMSKDLEKIDFIFPSPQSDLFKLIS